MKVQSVITGVGAALVLALAAQNAQAQSCPQSDPDGGGLVLQEVSGSEEDCPVTGSPVALQENFVSETGEEYTVSAVIEAGDSYLLVGEYVEVEIELNDVMASLKANEQDAITLATELGIRKKGVVGNQEVAHIKTVSGLSEKLTESELKDVAAYLHIAMQNTQTIRGRSAPATNTSTTRLERAREAVSNAFRSLTRSLPNRGTAVIRFETFHENGRPRSRFEVGGEISRVEPIRDNQPATVEPGDNNP